MNSETPANLIDKVLSWASTVIPSSAATLAAYAAWKHRQHRLDMQEKHTAAETFRTRLEAVEKRFDDLLLRHQKLGEDHSNCAGKIRELEAQNQHQAWQIEKQAKEIEALRQQVKDLTIRHRS